MWRASHADFDLQIVKSLGRIDKNQHRQYPTEDGANTIEEIEARNNRLAQIIRNIYKDPATVAHLPTLATPEERRRFVLNTRAKSAKEFEMYYDVSLQVLLPAV